VQAQQGHEALQSTQIYTKVAIRKLKEVHTATHPSSRLGAWKGPRPPAMDSGEQSSPSPDAIEGGAGGPAAPNAPMSPGQATRWLRRYRRQEAPDPTK
jgi:integrase/recombinase XerD